ncbi:hypothetical protein [Spirosoma gilvum]
MSIKVKLYTLSVFIFHLAVSCQPQMKFDRQGWRERKDIWYINREQMVSDLLSNYQLKGMPVSDAIDLLGAPDSQDIQALNYKISEEYGSDIDPQQGKNLILLYTKDSTVTRIKLENWGNK